MRWRGNKMMVFIKISYLTLFFISQLSFSVELQLSPIFSDSESGLADLEESNFSLVQEQNKSMENYFKNHFPNLIGINFQQTEKLQRNNMEHLSWKLFCHQIPIFNATIKLHLRDGNVFSLQGNFPENFNCNDEDFTWIKSNENHTPVYFLQDEQVVRAWLERGDETKDYALIIIDDQTQEILFREERSFDLTREASVFEKNDLGKLVTKKIEDLSNGEFLDGKWFSIYNDDEKGERAKVENDLFTYDPFSESEKEFFDQVQTYYYLQKITVWYRDHFKYEPLTKHLPVYVNTLVDGQPHNAKYDHINHMILLGKGIPGTFENLARDSDVLYHEFSHEVIYQFLSALMGETGGLHEGYADYMAYALNDDPYLAETIRPTHQYLRTALLDDDQRLDNPLTSKQVHSLGQIWSATLWRLRKDIGEKFDQVVFNSFYYLSRQSGFKDALLGILHADMDLNMAENGQGGENYCKILRSAIDRGFVRYLTEVNSYDCGIDWEDEKQKSYVKYADLLPEEETAAEDTGKSLRLFGVACSVGAWSDQGSWPASFILLLIFPLVVMRGQRKF